MRPGRVRPLRYHVVMGAPELVLGIDPGTTVTGWGLVRRSGNRVSAAGYGAWRPKRTHGRAAKLAAICDHLDEALASLRPDIVALEQAFLGKNIQSALRLGEARGAIMASCARAGLEVVEFPTATVKKAVVGNGRADKSQVQFMLQRLLGLKEPPTPADAGDALALAFALAVDVGLAARLQS